MPTPRPFRAPTSFTPRIDSLAEVNRQVQRMRNLASRGGGPFPVEGPINPSSLSRAATSGTGGLMGKLGFLGQLTALPGAAANAWNGIQGLYEAGEGILKGRPTIETVRRLNTRGYQSTGPIGVGGIPARTNTGESYRDAELRLSAAARAAGGPSAGGGLGGGNMASFVPPPSSPTSPRSSSNFPRSGGSTGTFASIASPADRAYAQEVSRTAQLTAQNPEMQRYEAARQADLKSGDFSKSEDIGMEMWARKNKTLAKAVKPGQAGYDVIQRVLQEDTKPNVGAFAATTPIFPGAQNYFSGQYQTTPGATTPDLGAFTTQQNIPFTPLKSIGQFPFQPPTQAPALTQGFGSAPGVDTLGSFTRKQLSQDLLNKFAGLQK